MNMICPAHANPADFYMRMLSVNYPKTDEDEKIINQITSHYKLSIEANIAQEATQT